MASLTRVEVISPLSTIFWIREALVVPDDLHAIAEYIKEVSMILDVDEYPERYQQEAHSI